MCFFCRYKSDGHGRLLTDACEDWRAAFDSNAKCLTVRLNLGPVEAELTRTAPSLNSGENSFGLESGFDGGSTEKCRPQGSYRPVDLINDGARASPSLVVGSPNRGFGGSSPLAVKGKIQSANRSQWFWRGRAMIKDPTCVVGRDTIGRIASGPTAAGSGLIIRTAQAPQRNSGAG